MNQEHLQRKVQMKMQTSRCVVKDNENPKILRFNKKKIEQLKKNRLKEF